MGPLPLHTYSDWARAPTPCVGRWEDRTPRQPLPRPRGPKQACAAAVQSLLPVLPCAPLCSYAGGGGTLEGKRPLTFESRD